MDGYRETLLLETREELAKADAKASILLAASGIIVTALVTVGGSNAWSPAHLHHAGARVLGWAALGIAGVGVLLVAAAVKPRLRAKRPELRQPHYFGDVEAYWPRWWVRTDRQKRLEAGRAAFGKAIATVSEEDALERLDDQIWSCSHIAYRKYRFLSVGMWLWGVSVACVVAAVMVEKQWP